MSVGELPSVNDTLFSWPKRSHLIIEPPLFRAGFAIPEGAPLSGDHCTNIFLLKWRLITFHHFQNYHHIVYSGLFYHLFQKFRLAVQI